MDQHNKIGYNSYEVQFDWTIELVKNFPWAQENFVETKKIEFEGCEATCVIKFYPKLKIDSEGKGYHHLEFCFQDNFPDALASRHITVAKCFICTNSGQKTYEARCDNLFSCKSPYYKVKTDTLKIPIRLVYYVCNPNDVMTVIPKICIETVPDTETENEEFVMVENGGEKPSEGKTKSPEKPNVEARDQRAEICGEILPEIEPTDECSFYSDAESIEVEIPKESEGIEEKIPKESECVEAKISKKPQRIEDYFFMDEPVSKVTRSAESIETEKVEEQAKLIQAENVQNADNLKSNEENSERLGSPRQRVSGKRYFSCMTDDEDSETSEPVPETKLSLAVKAEEKLAKETNEYLTKIIKKLSPSNKDSLDDVNWISLKMATKENKDNWGTLLAKQARIDSFFDVLHCAHIWDFQLQKELVVNDFIVKQDFKTLQRSEGWKKLKEQSDLYQEVVEMVLEKKLTSETV